MNKKGFTLIEILVSITLVTIVLVFMLNALVRLKGVYNDSDKDTDIRIFGSLISREINNDFIYNKGVRSITCKKESNEHSCDIELNSGEKRKLVLRVHETKSETTNNTYYIDTISTVEYLDSINNSTMFIKSVNSKSYYTNNVFINSDHYHFNAISYEKKDSGILVITIKATDKKYDVRLYSNS